MSTRRSFLIATIRAAGGLVIAAGAPATTPGALSPSAASAKRGGTLISADTGDPTSLDPAFTPATAGSRIGRMIYDQLIDIDAKGNPIPALAERWDTLDPATYVLHLRKGVKFHDGTTFDAEAVKFNLDRHLDPKTKSLRRGELQTIANVDVVDSSTVKIRLRGPDVGFLVSLWDRPGYMLSPTAVKAKGDAFGTSPIGTGPFKFVEYVQNDHTTVERNSEYWMPDRPYVERIIHRVTPV